jgi:FlaA1/EpsC-like NDP-sugar epimerase
MASIFLNVLLPDTKTFKANLMASTIFLVLIYFFANGRISRLTIIFYFLISTIGFISLRLSVRNVLRRLRKKGRNLRHVLLVGNSKQLVSYIHTVYSHKDSGVRFLGWIDKRVS